MPTRTRTDAAILESFRGIVVPLNRALPGPSEVVLHDLTQAPFPVLAIAGSLTGRSVGAPATGLLLRAAAERDYATMVGFEAGLPDGRRARVSTMIVRGADERPLAALCLISDMSIWDPVREFFEAMLPGGRWPGADGLDQPAVDPHDESFPGDLTELADRLLDDAIAAVGVPVELMQKRHKLAVVEHLDQRGFFLMRDAVARTADVLDVTRYSVYNYLKELGIQPDGNS